MPNLGTNVGAKNVLNQRFYNNLVQRLTKKAIILPLLKN